MVLEEGERGKSLWDLKAEEEPMPETDAMVVAMGVEREERQRRKPERG